jgi:hypothetical protein
VECSAAPAREALSTFKRRVPAKAALTAVACHVYALQSLSVSHGRVRCTGHHGHLIHIHAADSCAAGSCACCWTLRHPSCDQQPGLQPTQHARGFRPAPPHSRTACTWQHNTCTWHSWTLGSSTREAASSPGPVCMCSFTTRPQPHNGPYTTCGDASDLAPGCATHCRRCSGAHCPRVSATSFRLSCRSVSHRHRCV